MARYTAEQMKTKRDNLSLAKNTFRWMRVSPSRLLTKEELQAITRREEFNRTYIRDDSSIDELFKKRDSRLPNGGFIFDEDGSE